MGNTVLRTGITLISVATALIISGCTSIQDKSLDISDLNISRNSAMLEHENIKAATAILIKKSKQYDMLVADNKNMLEELNGAKKNILSLQKTVDDQSMKISFLSGDMVTLSGLVKSLQEKKAILVTDTNNSVPKKEHVNVFTDTQIVVPKVEIVKMPVNKNVPNQKPKEKKVIIPIKKEKVEICQPSNHSSDKSTHPLVKKDGPIETKIVAKEIVKSPFVPSVGKVLLKNDAFFYSSPSNEQKNKGDKVKEGALIEYIGKSKNWYQISDGKYLEKVVAVDVSLNQKK